VRPKSDGFDTFMGSFTLVSFGMDLPVEAELALRAQAR
jgi:hypothetical protein